MTRQISRKELIDWVRRNVAVKQLCEAGGWPDSDHAKIHVCGKSGNEWIVNVTLNESIMEISECDVAEYSRCGKFAVSLDDAGRPEGIRLLYPM